MSKAKHTPLPWKVQEEPHPKFKTCVQFRIDSPKRALMMTAEAWKFKDDPKVLQEVRANLQVAAASPELLRELKFWRNVAINLLTDSQLDAVMTKERMPRVRNTPRNRLDTTDKAIMKAGEMI